MVENTPESAMTAAPHTTVKANSHGRPVVKNSGESRQHAPLTVRAAAAVAGRPTRSAAQPPSRQPASPATPIARKASMPEPPGAGSPVVVVLLTTRNVGSHVHNAYSSHMCPK